MEDATMWSVFGIGLFFAIMILLPTVPKIKKEDKMESYEDAMDYVDDTVSVDSIPDTDNREESLITLIEVQRKNLAFLKQRIQRRVAKWQKNQNG